MYNILQLKHLKTKPKINDISLHLLCEYYEVFLNPFIYQYEIEFANHTKRILKLQNSVKSKHNFNIIFRYNTKKHKLQVQMR